MIPNQNEMEVDISPQITWILPTEISSFPSTVKTRETYFPLFWLDFAKNRALRLANVNLGNCRRRSRSWWQY